MRSRKFGKTLRLSLSYLYLIVGTGICLYPILWVLLASFRPGTSLYSKTFIPEQWTWVHYRELFTDSSFMFGTWYRNTVEVSLMTMILGTLLVVLTGYSFSRFRFKGRSTALTGLLILNMFPGFMSLIALFILLKELNLLDTHLALVLIYSAGAPVFGTFIAKGFFDTIPRSLDEAARMDGAGNFRIFIRINLPLARPMLAYAALTQFVAPWVDFIVARLVLRSKSNWTVAVGLWDTVNHSQGSHFTMFAAASVLVALPIALLFVLLQRFLVTGLTEGASKG